MERLSVTGLIKNYHSFEKEFWLDYKTLEALLDPETFNSIKILLLKKKRFNLKDFPSIDKEEFEKSKEELRNTWDAERLKAKEIGIATHEMIHNLFCTDRQSFSKYVDKDISSYPSDANTAFLTCKTGMFAELKLEVPLNEDFILIGIPDFIIINEDLSVDIWDWKTSEKAIRFKSMYDLGKKHSKKFKYPLTAHDDAEGILYLLQLSLYMWMILTLRPDLHPGNLNITWIQENKVKKNYPILYLQKDVTKLIHWHVKHLALSKAFKACRTINYEL